METELQKSSRNVKIIKSKKNSLNNFHQVKTDYNIPKTPHVYNPPRLIIYIALVCLTFSNLGSYFDNDIPQLLDQNFRIKFKVNRKQVEHLYSIYYISSLPLTILTPYFISKLGGVTIALIYIFWLFLSNLIAFYASISNIFSIFQISKFMEGLTAETADIAIETVICIWFKGKFMSVALSLYGLFTNISSSLANYSVIKIMNYFRDINKVFLISSLIALFSVFMMLILQMISLEREMVEDTNEKIRRLEDLEYEREKKKEENFKYVVKQLNKKRIWFSIIFVLLTDSIYYSLTTFLTGFLKIKFGFSSDECSNLLVYPPLFSGISGLLVGFLTLKYGKKIMIMIIVYSSMILTLVYLIITKGREGEYILVAISLSILGIFNGTNRTVGFSILGLIIPEKSLSLGFSIMELLSNVLVVTNTYFIGLLIEEGKLEGYIYSIWIILGILIIGFICILIVKNEDNRMGGFLEFSENSLESVAIKRIIDFGSNKKKDIKLFLRKLELERVSLLSE